MTLPVPAPIAAAAVAADAALAPLLLAVAHEESGFDPNAVGGVGEEGLTQIYPRYWRALTDQLYGAGASLFDPRVNFGVAAAIMRERLAANGGDLYDALQPWSTRPGAWALYQAGAFAGAVGGSGPVASGGPPGAALAARPLLVVGALGLALWLLVEVLD